MRLHVNRHAFALALLAMMIPGPGAAYDVRGVLTFPNARVVDGDGIAMGRVEVRLQGIAAPEDRRGRVDPGGKASSEALRQLAEGREVICRLDGTRASSGRPVGRCSVEGMDLGWAMVRAGHARDCPAFSEGDYAEAEALARVEGRDLSAIYALPDYCR